MEHGAWTGVITNNLLGKPRVQYGTLSTKHKHKHLSLIPYLIPNLELWKIQKRSQEISFTIFTNKNDRTNIFINQTQKTNFRTSIDNPAKFREVSMPKSCNSKNPDFPDFGMQITDQTSYTNLFWFSVYLHIPTSGKNFIVIPIVISRDLRGVFPPFQLLRR